MGEQRTQAEGEVVLSAVVTRCGCGDPDGHRGTPCPRPAAVEDLGEVSRGTLLGWLFGQRG